MVFCVVLLESSCGDGVCSTLENCISCPHDCQSPCGNYCVLFVCFAFDDDAAASVSSWFFLLVGAFWLLLLFFE